MIVDPARRGVFLNVMQIALAAGLALATGAASAAATIIIVNVNAAGEGFNDPTPAAPVGGNAGTTLGQQRLNAFQAAANVWGATLTSSQPITIRASFEPLACTATSGTLGSATAFNVWRDFPGAGKPNTLYPQALANKITGTNMSAGNTIDGEDILARFNSRLGLFPDCLPGSTFYLGLDNNHGQETDLVTVLLHEFGHGLGFQTFTNSGTGAQLFGNPAIWDHYLLDTTTNKLWVEMTDAERVASAINFRKLVWTGANVTASVPQVLTFGTPQLVISGPAAGAAAATYTTIGTASFGAPVTPAGVTGQLMPVVDSPNQIGLACNPLSAANALAVNGRIALVDRGTCAFVVKAKNAQDAGAIGVIVANNVAGGAPGMTGTDPTLTIPVISVSQANGNTLKTALARRSRTASGVIATLGTSNQYAGADALGRALLYTPNPREAGSSVSHFDTIAFPNQLMEPFASSDLQHSVAPPADLTFRLLQDIGW